MRRSIFVSSFLLIILVHLQAQTKQDYSYSFPSKAFEKERTIYVHVPEDYYKNEDSLGVVYVLDAQAPAFWNNAKSVIDYLVWSHQIMPLIVVGIHSDYRRTEFMQKSANLEEIDPDNSGEAVLLQQHFKEEVFPMIADSFRVNEFRAIVGHSRGGNFLLHTLFGPEKDLFHAYLALSPVFHYLEGQTKEEIISSLSKKEEYHKFLYFSHGNVGSGEQFYMEQSLWLDSILQKSAPSHLIFKKEMIEGATHFTSVAPGLVKGLTAMNQSYTIDALSMQQILENDQIPIASQIEAYESNQLKHLNLFFPLKPDKYRRYANDMLDEENFEKAIELYDLCNLHDPLNFQSYMGKAHALKEQGKIEAAKKCYDIALEVVQSGKTWLSEKGMVNWSRAIKNEKRMLDR
jgi:predicted alpha/beta superfamily hydrolase